MSLYVMIQILMWTILVFYFIMTIVTVAMCSPRKKIWNPLMKTGRCFNSNAIYLVTGWFNVASDFLILILPIIPIWRLQMPLRRKFAILAIFATGAL